MLEQEVATKDSFSRAVGTRDLAPGRYEGSVKLVS